MGRPAGRGVRGLEVIDEVEVQSGLNFMYSLWRPDAVELEALQKGGAVRLGVGGTVHPVVNLAVCPRATCEAVGATGGGPPPEK